MLINTVHFFLQNTNLYSMIRFLDLLIQYSQLKEKKNYSAIKYELKEQDRKTYSNPHDFRTIVTFYDSITTIIQE